MKNKIQYRQGDVFVTRITKLPANLKPKARENGDIVLAHGEVTGHHHGITDDHVQGWVDDAGVTYLDVKEAMAALHHQEHSTIPIEPGFYRVVRQREYSPEAIRNVAD